MHYGSRRPHLVPLLLAKNSKLRLQFTNTRQKWSAYFSHLVESMPLRIKAVLKVKEGPAHC